MKKWRLVFLICMLIASIVGAFLFYTARLKKPLDPPLDAILNKIKVPGPDWVAGELKAHGLLLRLEKPGHKASLGIRTQGSYATTHKIVEAARNFIMTRPDEKENEFSDIKNQEINQKSWSFFTIKRKNNINQALWSYTTKDNVNLIIIYTASGPDYDLYEKDLTNLLTQISNL